MAFFWPVFPLSRRAVRGNFSRNNNWFRTRSNLPQVVVRGLDPRIHAFVSGARRRGWGGPNPPRQKEAGRFSPLSGRNIFPGQPTTFAGMAIIAGTSSAVGTLRLLIATGADRDYFPLLRDTVLSIRAHRRDVAVGILDLGLDGEQREWLSP